MIDYRYVLALALIVLIAFGFFKALPFIDASSCNGASIYQYPGAYAESHGFDYCEAVRNRAYNNDSSSCFFLTDEEFRSACLGSSMSSESQLEECNSISEQNRSTCIINAVAKLHIPDPSVCASSPNATMRSMCLGLVSAYGNTPSYCMFSGSTDGLCIAAAARSLANYENRSLVVSFCDAAYPDSTYNYSSRFSCYSTVFTPGEGGHFGLNPAIEVPVNSTPGENATIAFFSFPEESKDRGMFFAIFSILHENGQSGTNYYFCNSTYQSAEELRRYCVSADGETRWNLEFPAFTWAAGSDTFPWIL